MCADLWTKAVYTFAAAINEVEITTSMAMKLVIASTIRLMSRTHRRDAVIRRNMLLMA